MRIFRTRPQQGFVPQSFDFEAASRPDPPPAGIGSSIARLSSMPDVIALKIWRSGWPKPKTKPEKIKPPQPVARGGGWFQSGTLESRRREEFCARAQGASGFHRRRSRRHGG